VHSNVLLRPPDLKPMKLSLVISLFPHAILPAGLYLIIRGSHFSRIAKMPT